MEPIDTSKLKLLKLKLELKLAINDCIDELILFSKSNSESTVVVNTCYSHEDLVKVKNVLLLELDTCGYIAYLDIIRYRMPDNNHQVTTAVKISIELKELDVEVRNTVFKSNKLVRRFQSYMPDDNWYQDLINKFIKEESNMVRKPINSLKAIPNDADLHFCKDYRIRSIKKRGILLGFSVRDTYDGYLEFTLF